MACDSAKTHGKDVNDLFDDIVLAEDRFQHEGYTEGLQAGRGAGYEDGYKVGVDQGRLIGSELGFYKGFVSTWQILIDQNGQGKNPRKTKALQSLIAMIEQFSLSDPSQENLMEELHRIRAKFKQVASLLKVNPEYGGEGGNKGMSF